MEEYKGYVILGRAQIVPGRSTEFRAQGIVFTNNPEGSVRIKHIEGHVFKSQRAAEKEGLQLCKEWLDKSSDFSRARLGRRRQ